MLKNISRIRTTPCLFNAVKGSERESRFIADRMLGRLARYLRLIGYDVSYPPTCPDAELIGLARSEKRVLLTRDRGILGQESALKGRPEVVEISSVEVLDQIAQLAEEGWIPIFSPRAAPYVTHPCPS